MGTDIHGVWQAKINNQWTDIESNYEQYRHYLLFAWLADVRNGYGFAGVPTHEPIKPIALPRGYPEDFKVSDDEHPITKIDILPPNEQKYFTEKDSLSIWMGDHSHSWVTAEEILNASLPVIEKTGIISIEDYQKWNKVSQPETWCGGITGPNVKINVPNKISKETTHVAVVWLMPLVKEFDYFIQEVKRLKALHGEVRFVFGFDS